MLVSRQDDARYGTQLRRVHRIPEWAAASISIGVERSGLSHDVAREQGAALAA
jgi:hypothetical protein